MSTPACILIPLFSKIKMLTEKYMGLTMGSGSRYNFDGMVLQLSLRAGIIVFMILISSSLFAIKQGDRIKEFSLRDYKGKG
jgi:hypothetical protein